MTLLLDRLAPAVRAKAAPFLAELAAAAAPRLHSLHVVGSAVTPDWVEGRSDVNTLLVLGEMDLAVVEAIAREAGAVLDQPSLLIGVSTVVFLALGRPVAVLVAVGALNGLILPLGLGAMLVASRRPALLNGARHPAWLTAAGWVVAVAMGVLGARTLVRDVPGLFR